MCMRPKKLKSAWKKCARLPKPSNAYNPNRPSRRFFHAQTHAVSKPRFPQPTTRWAFFAPAQAAGPCSEPFPTVRVSAAPASLLAGVVVKRLTPWQTPTLFKPGCGPNSSLPHFPRHAKAAGFAWHRLSYSMRHGERPCKPPPPKLRTSAYAPTRLSTLGSAMWKTPPCG